MKNLLLRFISGIILLLSIFFVFHLGPTAVKVACGIISAILFWEVILSSVTRYRVLLIVGVTLIAVSAPFQTDNTTVLLGFLFVLIGLAWIPRENRILKIIVFEYVLVGQYLFLVLVCNISENFYYYPPLILLSIVIATDIGGFIVGKIFGRFKLAPSISPNKTWEGLIGGISFAVVLNLAFFELPGSNLIKDILFVITISTFSQLGDLLESYGKRTLSVKDSGWIIPGHGGLFDRVDSILGAIFGYSLLVVLGF